jgi:hypothetical protein
MPAWRVLFLPYLGLLEMGRENEGSARVQKVSIGWLCAGEGCLKGWIMLCISLTSAREKVPSGRFCELSFAAIEESKWTNDNLRRDDSTR